MSHCFWHDAYDRRGRALRYYFIDMKFIGWCKVSRWQIATAKVPLWGWWRTAADARHGQVYPSTIAPAT